MHAREMNHEESTAQGHGVMPNNTLERTLIHRGRIPSAATEVTHLAPMGDADLD
jgi:hypothetical protein